jgi:hypothetical protein
MEWQSESQQNLNRIPKSLRFFCSSKTFVAIPTDIASRAAPIWWWRIGDELGRHYIAIKQWLNMVTWLNDNHETLGSTIYIYLLISINQYQTLIFDSRASEISRHGDLLLCRLKVGTSHVSGQHKRRFHVGPLCCSRRC